MDRVKVRVSGNTLKYVFGQISIRASILDPRTQSSITMPRSKAPPVVYSTSGKKLKLKVFFSSFYSKIEHL